MTDMLARTASPEVPTGHVTLVFTDVQGSTNLWERHTDAMREALQRHNDLLRQLLREHGGYEVKTEGDAFMVAFTSPLEAVRWCLLAQEDLLTVDWPSEVLGHEDAAEVVRGDGYLLMRGLRVRMGVHAGFPDCQPDTVTGRMDYFGPMVNRAARVGAAGHGGQIVVSGSVWREVAGHLDALQAEAKTLGEHRLKGLESPETLVQLLPRRLSNRRFAPLKTQDVRQTNMTPHPTRFVGRKRDLARLAAAYSQGDRLVTLLGPGGTGKTRLSQQFGLDHLADFEGGVWFCDLTEATDQEGVCEALSRTLNVTLMGKTDKDMIEHLCRAIQGHGRALFIFDNFEQVVACAPATIGHWLLDAPECHFLVSSREVLRLPGETVYELAPLGLPESDADPSASEAVELFVERVRAVRPNFTMSEAEASTVAEIVRQLDGIPLAIELAAARMGVLTPGKLLERLPRRFDLLSSGKRDASARQGTLRGLIDWSWNLLQPWEQAALMQCTVFRGGFTLEAAEEVLDLSAFPEAPWALDAVQGLRDKSLLYGYECAEALDELRFGMYVSIREYAAEKLRQSEEARGAEARHAAYYLQVGEAWAEELFLGGTSERLLKLYKERENLMEVHTRALATQPMTDEAATETLRVALALDPVVSVKGPFAPHLSMLNEALRVSDRAGVQPLLRAKVLAARGRMQRFVGLHPENLRDQEAALAIALEEGDVQLQILCHHMIGLGHQNSGDLSKARLRYERALELLRQMPNHMFEGQILLTVGSLHLEEGKPHEAKQLLERAVQHLKASGNRRFETIARSHLGYILLELEEEAAAQPHFEQALEICREIGDRRSEALMMGSFGDHAFLKGELGEALLNYERCLSIVRDIGDRRFSALYLSRKGGLLASLGRTDEAAHSLNLAHEVLEIIRDPVFETAYTLHSAQLGLAQTKEALKEGNLAAIEARCKAVQALIDELEAPGPSTSEHPQGAPSKAAQSDELRLSLRMVKRDLRRHATS